MSLLTARKNPYQGLRIEPSALPVDTVDFANQLAASLSIWQDEGIKVVWLPIPSAHAALVPLAVAAGFAFHHCSNTQVTLTKRLQAAAHIPDAATHSIGVGAVVISAQNEVLTVLEKSDQQKRPGFFKLPGGMLERGEHIATGAMREVWEETGIHTNFMGLLGLRHHHQGQFDSSNIYFVCRLHPLSHVLTVDGEEIAEARWIDIDTYLNDPLVGQYGKYALRAALAAPSLSSITLDGYMGAASDYEIFSPTPSSAG